MLLRKIIQATEVGSRVEDILLPLGLKWLVVSDIEQTCFKQLLHVLIGVLELVIVLRQSFF